MPVAIPALFKEGEPSMSRNMIVIALCTASAGFLAPSASAQEGSRADIRRNLDNARSATFAVRSAASDVVTLRPSENPQETNRVIARFGRMAHQARGHFVRGRRSLALGIQNGIIGEAEAAQFRRLFDRYETDLLKAVQKFEDNLKFEWPSPPRPEAPVPEEPGEDPEDGEDPLLPEDVAGFLVTLKEFRSLVKEANDRGHQRFGYGNASTMLDKAFQEGGVEWARRYSSSWGGWLYVDIHATATRHGSWLDVIGPVIARLEKGQAVEIGYLRILRSAMSRWETERGKIDTLCDQLIEHIVRRGLKMDESNRQANRYYALHTTDSAAAAAAWRLKKLADKAAGQELKKASKLTAEIENSTLLFPPQAYNAWLKENPPPAHVDTPAPEPETESDRFREEVIRLYREMESRLGEEDSLLWNWENIQSVAENFDSRYYIDLWTFYDFNGERMIGGEVNYYFQGMFWRRMGIPRWFMFRIIDAWNIKSGRELGNRNQYIAAGAGWDDLNRAKSHPEGVVKFFESDDFDVPRVRLVGPNPERRIPGYED